MKPSPAFQAYPSDWLSSKSVALMTPAEEGAYWRLLCYCWMDPDCSLSDDDDELSKLSRLNEGWLRNGSNLVRKCFISHPTIPGRITNQRLMDEREKQRLWREKSSAGGKKSGKTRRNKEVKDRKGGSRVVEPSTKQNPTLQSSSSVSPLLSSSSSLSLKEKIAVPVGIGDVVIGQSEPKKRERKPIWDALVDVLNYEPKSEQEQKNWGKVHKGLLELNAIPDHVHSFANGWRHKYPTTHLTINTFLPHWGEFVGERQKGDPIAEASMRKLDEIQAQKEQLRLKREAGNAN